MKRLKTGVEGLDKLLNGGFPEKSSILLVGPPGCGKSILAQQFVYEGLKENQPAIYATLDTSPEGIIEDMKNFGWKITKPMSDKLKFIDAYSWRVGKPTGKHAISNLTNINELNIAFSGLLKTLNTSELKRTVFDSVSTLLLYADPSLVVKFIPVMIAKSKKSGYTQLLILEEGVHDEKTVSTLNYLTDGVIKFKLEEDNRYLKIERMKSTEHSAKWIKFKLTNKGLVV